MFAAQDCDEGEETKNSEQGNEDRLDQVICCWVKKNSPDEEKQ